MFDSAFIISLSPIEGAYQDRPGFTDHFFFFRVISVEEIIAVSGMARIMPRLEARPLMISSETKGVENR